MKHFFTKKICCNLFAGVGQMCIMPIVLFSLFFLNAGTTNAGNVLSIVTAQPTDVNGPACVAGFKDSTSDLLAFFTDTSTGVDANTEYKWQFGDGGISHQANPQHLYKTAGPFTVCLTIKNKLTNCFDSVCHTVTVTQCVANFITVVDTTNIRPPGFVFVSFTNASLGTTDRTRYIYSVDSGKAGGFERPNFQGYAPPGEYLICLTISQPGTGCLNTFCDTLKVPLILSSCQAGFSSSSLGTHVTFTDTSKGISAFTNYHWDFGDGGISHQQNPVHVYASGGTYNVCETISDTSVNFCNSTVCNNVVVVPIASSCQAAFTNTDTDLVATFTDASTGTDNNTVYSWNFGDGGISHQVNPVHRFPSGGTYTVCLSLKNGATNCFDSICHDVVITQCQAIFDTSRVGGIANGNTISVISTSTGVDPNTVYTWTFGDGGIGHKIAQNHTYGAPGRYQVCLTISNSKTGCFSQACDSITVAPFISTCTAAFNSSPDNLVANFTDASSGVNGGTNYSWNFGDGGVSHLQNPTHRYAGTGTYTVCLSIENLLAGCSDSICHSVTITQCQASFDTSVTNNKLTVTSISTGVDANTTYTWDFGDGGIGHMASQSHTYATSGTYTVCLTISNSATGCSNQFCESVTTLPFVSTCQAAFNSSSNILIAGFNNMSTGTDNNTTYSWNFGDGGVSHQMNPTHRYAAANTYTVCLTIKNLTTGCFDSVCHDITISQCQASFDTSVNGNQLTVTSTSTGVDANTTYTWNFGDGGIGHQATQSHIYSPSGTVCSAPITLSNKTNTATPANFEQMVVVNSSLFSANELTDLQNVEFTTSSGGGTPLNAWLESGDTNTSTNTVWWVNLGSNIIPANGSLTIYMNFMGSSIMSASGPTGEAPQLSGTYAQFDDGALVFPEFYDNFAGTSLASQWTDDGSATVAVNNGLTLSNANSNWNAIYTNTFSSALNNVAESYCASSNTNGGGLCINTSGTDGNGVNDGSTGVDAQLCGPSGSGYMFGSGGSCTSAPNANATLANATPANNTYYVLSFFMYNTPVLELNYGAFTSLTGTNGAVNAISPTSEVGLAVSQGSNGSFQWYRNRQSPPNGIMPTANAGSLTCHSANGKYDVCLTISNSATGCSSTTCDSVTIKPFISTCTAAFSSSSNILIANFTDASTGTDNNTTYDWNFGDGGVSHQQNPSHRYAGAGTYTTCLTIKNSSTGCFDSVCHDITITQCQAAFDTTVNGFTLNVSSTSTGVDANTTYDWNFGDGGIGHQPTQNHIYTSKGTYNVCLTISNSATGCSSQFCENVVILPFVSTCTAGFKDSSSNLVGYFTDTSKGEAKGTTWNWQFGDGGISHQQNPIHHYASASTYVVCLEISNLADTCFSVSCGVVTIDQCVASFDTTTSGLKLNVSSTSTGVDSNTTYVWSFGDGGIGHQASQSHIYAAGNTYTVCLTISNSATGCTDTTCEQVTVKKPVNICGASFTSSSNLLDATFKNTSTGTTASTKYNWHFGDGGVSHQKDPSHVYAATGTYEVCLNITDSTLSFCDSTFCDSVTISGLISECSAKFTWKDIKGQGIKFTDHSTGTTSATQYTWDLGDGTVLKNEKNPSHRYNETAGKYYVCLTITDTTEACNSIFCDTVNFTTGIDPLSFPGSTIYYDPVSSQLVVNWNGTDNVDIHLVDIIGRNQQDIYSGNLYTGLYHFNVNSSTLSTGIYLIHITAHDGDKSWKIFVQPH